jgi:hypothetical protein
MANSLLYSAFKGSICQRDFSYVWFLCLLSLKPFLILWADKAERLIAGAAAYGSQLVVFPEAFVGGYPHGVMFEAPSETHLSNKEFQKYLASAIDVPGTNPFH